jgi:hypothetical protein
MRIRVEFNRALRSLKETQSHLAGVPWKRRHTARKAAIQAGVLNVRPIRERLHRTGD